MRRVSVSLPDDLVDRVDQVAQQLGFSRSALVAVLVDVSLTSVSEIIGALLPPPVAGDVRRYRGESAADLRKIMTQILSEVDEYAAGGGT